MDSNYACEGIKNDEKILLNNTHYILLLFMNMVIAICINSHKLINYELHWLHWDDFKLEHYAHLGIFQLQRSKLHLTLAKAI